MMETHHSMGPSPVQSQYVEPNIEGALNLRDFGGYPSNVRQGAMTRRGFIYRSGHLSHITSKGWDKMREQLRISTIFRLTDSNEASTLYGDIQSEKIKNFHLVHLPFHQEGFDKTSIFTKYSRHVSEGHSVVAQGYLTLLRESPAIFRNVLLRIRDYPDDVYIIHCSMGKDRTGVVFALLLWLAGVSEEIVSAEYSLSEDALQCLIPGIFRLAQETAPCGTSVEECQRIAQEAIKARKATMLLTMKMVRAEFGGVVEYAKEHCGLSKKDIHIVQHNLVH